MAKEFYIDRQFGVAIFIDVENGIVQKCYNEKDSYNAKMNELYKGKTISFLKEDFEKRMSGTYHNVRSLEVTYAVQRVAAVESRIKHINIKLSSYDTTKEEKVELKKNRKVLNEELTIVGKECADMITRVQTEHNFN